jgi:hypothetical protein
VVLDEGAYVVNSVGKVPWATAPHADLGKVDDDESCDAASSWGSRQMKNDTARSTYRVSGAHLAKRRSKNLDREDGACQRVDAH